MTNFGAGRTDGVGAWQNASPGRGVVSARTDSSLPVGISRASNACSAKIAPASRNEVGGI